MKQTGICPKCEGQEIYTDADCTKRGDRASIGFSSWKKYFIDTYICMNCGFIEEYVEKEDLLNEKKFQELKLNWKKR